LTLVAADREDGGMPRAVVPRPAGDGGPEIELEYVTHGDPDGVPLLLINGFNSQLIAWPPTLLDAAVAAGFHVITFDNRDCGLSTRLDGLEVDVAAALHASRRGGEMPPVPYLLSDMAADAAGLLDVLGIDRVHVLGVSMGGMIAQTFAIEHPARTRSLISVMSFTGEWEYGSPTREAGAVLLTPPPRDRDAYIANSELTKVWQSRRWFDGAATRQRAAEAYDRAFYAEGAPRQLAAIYASGSRAEALAALTVPTLVIHGRDDTLIPPAGGQRTAELIPAASLLLLADMGHDLPEPLEPMIAGAITNHARLADARLADTRP
jgi:pimeloyl-ACP methyl ester carboxylesterase